MATLMRLVALLTVMTAIWDLLYLVVASPCPLPMHSRDSRPTPSPRRGKSLACQDSPTRSESIDHFLHRIAPDLHEESTADSFFPHTRWPTQVEQSSSDGTGTSRIGQRHGQSRGQESRIQLSPSDFDAFTPDYTASSYDYAEPHYHRDDRTPAHQPVATGINSNTHWQPGNAPPYPYFDTSIKIPDRFPFLLANYEQRQASQHQDTPRYHKPTANMRQSSVLRNTISASPSRASKDTEATSKEHDKSTLVKQEMEGGRRATPEAPPSRWNVHQVLTLHVDPRFHYESEDDQIYTGLSDRQKSVILELVHRVRPLRAAYARSILQSDVTPGLAKDLMSGDRSRVDAAIETLFPERDRRNNPVRWMTGLSHWERIEVIERMSAATHQSSDLLRDLFLAQNVQPGLARTTLSSDPPTCEQIANENMLWLKSKSTELPWQIGVSKVQKKAILDRMTAYGVRKNTCYDLLSKKPLPLSYGWQLLDASDHQFALIMNNLRRRKDVPLLLSELDR
ncbi:hypothetical protein CBS101457_000090 [Exobasidium rhododendri]|nr:hypothetical protein CBS101457_000090 [Exobasidium rhododendri]